MSYPWYEVVNEKTILQVDILEGFGVIVPMESEPDEQDNLKSSIDKYDVIVMSQSCDLENDKVDFVLLCPILDKDMFIETAPPGLFKSQKRLEQIRQGYIPGLHMLAECNEKGLIRPVRIVNFHKIFSMPVNYVKAFAVKSGDRIRLCPPYREHLSQSFARYFMRVGLPINIPKFK